MEELADAHPDAAEVIDLGTSVEGPFVGLRLTGPPLQGQAARPRGPSRGRDILRRGLAASMTASLRTLLLPTFWTKRRPGCSACKPGWPRSLRRYNANSVDLNPRLRVVFLIVSAGPAFL